MIYGGKWRKVADNRRIPLREIHWVTSFSDKSFAEESQSPRLAGDKPKSEVKICIRSRPSHFAEL